MPPRRARRTSAALATAIAAALAAAMPGTATADDSLPDVGDPFYYLRSPIVSEPVPDAVLKPKNALAPDVNPANGAVVNQTPPVFRWPPRGDVAAWQFRLVRPDGSAVERATPDNWLFLSEPLPPGVYRWSLRAWPRTGQPTAFGPERSFTVPKNAHAFLVPDAAEAFQRAAKAKRPRSLPSGAEMEALLAVLKLGDRRPEFDAFVRRAERNIGGEMLPEPPQATYDVEDICERATIGKVISKTLWTETLSARFAAYVYVLTGDERFRDEALRRTRNMLAWDPRGPTGLRSSGHGSREIAFALAQVLDLTWDAWPEAERQALIDHILVRTQELYDQLANLGHATLQEMPYNSHGYRHAGGVLAVAAMLAGDVPRARQWFMSMFPVYIAFNNPWGGDDGGFGNGLGYAAWNTEDFLRHWDVLRTATGTEVSRMAWPQEVGMFLSYFATAETPNGIFGDGAATDMRHVFEKLSQMYAQRVPTPIYTRYAAQWGDGGWKDPSVLFGPLSPEGRGKLADPGPVEMPDAAVFPSVGWVAMHSDLDDPMRNSLYFLSSPYGSFNHSYAAQNSFAVHARRRPLAIASGYYDYYRSDHHKNWTRQTLAHNTITFDDGQGQLADRKDAGGRIVAFEHHDDWDYATGDATAAYGGALSEARRTIAFLRPDTAVVYDSLASDTPRRFEWRIHALQQMTPVDQNTVRLEYEDASMCIDMVAGPLRRFVQTDEFTAEPLACLGDWPKQWHGRFETPVATQRAHVLAVLRMGCNPTGATDILPRDGGGFDLSIGDRRITIDRDGARLR